MVLGVSSLFAGSLSGLLLLLLSGGAVAIEEGRKPACPSLEDPP
jgi:hypothetical protein